MMFWMASLEEMWSRWMLSVMMGVYIKFLTILYDILKWKYINRNLDMSVCRLSDLAVKSG